MKEKDFKNLIESIKQVKAIRNGTMKPARVIKFSPNEVKKIREKLQILIKKAVIDYTQELNEIIDSKCREKRRIERVLDGMLDFCFDKNMIKLFKKLCRYYYDIDGNATAEYVLFYRDMWDSEAKGADPEFSKRQIGILKRIQIAS